METSARAIKVAATHINTFAGGNVGRDVTCNRVYLGQLPGTTVHFPVSRNQLSHGRVKSPLA
jgi:hypothetical protein